MNSTSAPKHLFQFELVPVENIKPWRGSDGSLSLSLYALTDGHFRISVGKEALLRYTPVIVSRWGLSNEDADYQVACFARDVFDSVPAVTSPIPTFFENIVRHEAIFHQLRKFDGRHSPEKVPARVIAQLEVEKANRDFKQIHYNAFRWLGERSIFLNYLKSCPDIWFVRVGNEVWIQWDNVDKKFEGFDVWTAQRGTYSISVQAFLAECHSLSERLLSAMESRIESIENGSARTRIPLETASLRNQLSVFKNEFEKSLSAKYQPDIDWEESEKAMRDIALESGITLPPA